MNPVDHVKKKKAAKLFSIRIKSENKANSKGKRCAKKLGGEKGN